MDIGLAAFQMVVQIVTEQVYQVDRIVPGLPVGRNYPAWDQVFEFFLHFLEATSKRLQKTEIGII